VALVLLASVSAAAAEGPSSLPHVIRAFQQHAHRVARRHLQGTSRQESGRRREGYRVGTDRTGDTEGRHLRIVRGTGIHRKSATGASQAGARLPAAAAAAASAASAAAASAAAATRLHARSHQGAATSSQSSAIGFRAGAVGVAAGAGGVALASGADAADAVPTPPPGVIGDEGQAVADGRQSSIDAATHEMGDTVPTPEEVLPLLPAGQTPNYVKRYATRVFRPDVVVAKDGSGNFTRVQVRSLRGEGPVCPCHLTLASTQPPSPQAPRRLTPAPSPGLWMPRSHFPDPAPIEQGGIGVAHCWGQGAEQ